MPGNERKNVVPITGIPLSQIRFQGAVLLSIL